MNPAMRTRPAPTERRRPSADRRRARHTARPAAAQVAISVRPEQRVRAAGTPLDLAHYGCDCGFGFVAPVSTSVCCPHCGGGQDW
jgi:hypothetical protein